ncbi:hypothetical protein ALC57_14868 [Trachymyrmex cornetzi]|uniref:Uncharacterized protein n=1 Tax=Trachymyrmex cornetzi TaxID=471704 RepID=A0A151IXX4_9HYME|nr:hypothetical protein ALC57_14868 [Trachymyrmex cornetzi]
MFLVVSDDLHSLTSKELEYISKIVLLRQFEYCIDLLWDRDYPNIYEQIRCECRLKRLTKSCDKRASLRTTYFQISVLRSGDAIGEAIGQRRSRY